MKDLKIDPSTSDIELTEDRDVTLVDSIMQDIYIKLRWFLGEWKFNTAAGINYYGEVFKKNPNLAVLESLIIRELLSVEGVTNITQFNITVDTPTRTAYINFTALINGTSKEEGRVQVSV